jgi:hypothetical protein
MFSLYLYNFMDFLKLPFNTLVFQLLNPTPGETEAFSKGRP